MLGRNSYTIVLVADVINFTPNGNSVSFNADQYASEIAAKRFAKYLGLKELELPVIFSPTWTNYSCAWE